MPPKGRIIVDETYCKGCELCVNACPQDVIILDPVHISAKGYHPAMLKGEGCTGCGICAIVCPESAITIYRENIRVKHPA